MQCPFCTAVLPDDDLFCEECGKALTTPHPAVCVCGAPEADLDDDGYCLQCGRRCRPAPEDHVEFELSTGFAAVTDRGLRHPRNEDRCRIAEEQNRRILVLCDGVSSSANAHLAAEAACQAIMNSVSAGATLAAAVRDACQAVAELGNTIAETAPSTTLVAAIVEESTIQIAWMGDSRAYWIADSASDQLTADHSWLNETIAAGTISYAEASQSPSSHGITRWLGADAAPDMVPEFREFHVPGPGWLLLCSDGLWNYAPQMEEIARLVFPKDQEGAAPFDTSALELCRRLVSFANDRGGQDNVSVALLRFES